MDFKKLILLLLVCTGVSAQDSYNQDGYVYEGGQSLIDLYNATGTTNLNAGDDQWSNSANFGFTFSRWGNDYTSARMSTNGCVNLYGSSKCSDYTPQALPYRDHTLYPFWTDLIRGTASGGQSSKMLFKAFDDYVVFGWYYMKEYNRSSSNSFEAILYANDTYEFRYRELDIQNHDVLIGEQKNSSEHTTYLFYDDNKNYNTFDLFDASHTNSLENGGSLYTGTLTEMCGINALYSSECSGYDAAVLAASCASNPLNDTSCPGYEAAYLSQQCGLNSLYSESCSGFAVAYFNQQCDLDPLYDTSCEGYAAAYAFDQEMYDTEEDMYMEEDYGYDDGYDEYGQSEDMYGYDEYGNAYTQDDLWYDEEFDEYLDPSDPCYEGNCDNFTDEDWYELDIEQFGQDQVDEWYGTDIEFAEDGFIDFSTMANTEEEFYTVIDEGMNEYDLEQEAIYAAEELAWALEEEAYLVALEEEYILQEELYLEELFEEELFEEEIFEEFEDLEELYEELELEDYEREALEEAVEEMEELFEEEISTDVLEEFIDDEAFEDLIEEEELEELLEQEEELFEEMEEEELEETLEIEREEVLVAEEREATPTATKSRKTNGVSRALATLRLAGGDRATASVVQQQISSSSSSGSSSGSSITSSGGSSSSFSTSTSTEQQQIVQSTGDTFALEQQEQQTGSVSIDAGNTNFSSVSVSAFEVAAEQQEATEQQQEFVFESGGSFGGSDSTFENKFDDALSTGQSIGQFLSQEAPNFSRFDIAPPTAQEQRTTSAVESLADRLGDQAAQENLQEQLENMDETGGFNDQSIAVAYIGYKPGFSSYTNQSQLDDQKTWYQTKEMYKGTKIDDNKFGFYMMAGKTELKLKEMIKSQYE
mgnify:FL=1